MSNVQLHNSWSDLGDLKYDAFIECAGSTDAVANGLGILVHGGVAIIEGICSRADTPIPAGVFHDAVLNDLTILATVNASHADHEDAVKLLSTLPSSLLSSAITSEIPPSDWTKWAHANRWPGIKTVVRFG
jgi:threonine dehydrogenase-like Zn-dependent dehydrogenase